MIKNISFVVVAKNEKFGINKCLGSLSKMALNDCEIICVDSGSTDGTLGVMKHYAVNSSIIHIYQCKGYVNSAIVRNVGLKHVCKRYIFFVDGDVELDPSFIVEALQLLDSGEADAVTGRLAEKYYPKGFSHVIKSVEDRYKVTSKKSVSYGSGIFITRSQLVKKIGDWDEAFVRNQDIEYTMRLSRHGSFFAIPVSMGTHHTLQYRVRSFEFLTKLYPIFYGIIIKKNFDRPLVLVEFLTNNKWIVKGFVAWLFLIMSLCFIPLFGFYLFWMWLILFLIDHLHAITKKKALVKRFVEHYLYVLIMFLGFFISINKKRPETVSYAVCND